MLKINTLPGFHAVHLKFSENYAPITVHLKEHSSHNYDEEKPIGRTIFIVNIPPYLTEHNLKECFLELGEISSVTLHKGIVKTGNSDGKTCNNGFQSGYLVFEKRESVVKILNSMSVGGSNCKLSVGLVKYAKEYNETICDHEILYEEATETVKSYDEKVDEEKMKEKDQVDSDGWTLVTRKGRNPGLALKESVNLKLKNKKKKTLKNFYAFQIRDEKKQRLAVLRQEHEESKKKIAEMKKLRTFKPY